MPAPSPSQMPTRRPVYVITAPSVEEPPEHYSLPPHAKRQAEAKGFSLQAVLEAADNPSISYESLRFPGQLRRIRGGIVTVCDPQAMKIITVYENTTETDLRPDQTDHDARSYGARLKERSA